MLKKSLLLIPLIWLSLWLVACGASNPPKSDTDQQKKSRPVGNVNSDGCCDGSGSGDW